MEISYRSNRFILNIMTSLAFFLSAQNILAANTKVVKSQPHAQVSTPVSKMQFVAPLSTGEVKPACNRLEGITMPCTGGGSPGGQCGGCGEAYPKSGDVCSGTLLGTACGGTVQCYGTKCCDTCDNHKTDHCGDMVVCGNVCPGSVIDCNQTVCLKPILSKGTAVFKNVQIGCDPWERCGRPVKAGDGCACTCATVGDTCEPRDTDKCTSCSCGKESGCNPKYEQQCIANKDEQCVTYEHVPAVSTGPCSCKCPDGTGPVNLPACGSCP